MDPCDLCHSQPCRPDCQDPYNMTGPSWAKDGYDRIQAEVDMVARLTDLVGKSAAMAVLREFRVTKREV